MRSSPKPVKRALACRDPRIDRDGYKSETSTRRIDVRDDLSVNADGTHDECEDIPHHEATRDREHPSGHDPSGDPPADRRETTRRADTEDRAGDRVRRGDRDAETRGDLDDGARGRLGREAL